jgi:hypothetical protein
LLLIDRSRLMELGGERFVRPWEKDTKPVNTFATTIDVGEK